MKRESGNSNPVRAVRWSNRAAIVEVVGDIDINRSTGFQAALLAVLDDKPERIIVHLGAVAYMDSSGVASLVKLLSRARKANTKVYLVQLGERVRSIFEITRLDAVFTICKTEPEALI